MNVIGFVETLADASGESRGPSGSRPESPRYSFFYGALVLLVSAIVCLDGSMLFARAALALILMLCVAVIGFPSVHSWSSLSSTTIGAHIHTGWCGKLCVAIYFLIPPRALQDLDWHRDRASRKTNRQR